MHCQRINGHIMKLTQSVCYAPFRKYLQRSGFLLYPDEFDCGNSNHPLVDIAARMGSFYWAFEYKSRNDNIGRGVHQVKSYSDWFDYVVLVSERPIRHIASSNYWHLRSLGAGMWNYYPLLDKCIMTKNPLIQSPALDKRKLVARRFSVLDRALSRRAPGPASSANYNYEIASFC